LANKDGDQPNQEDQLKFAAIIKFKISNQKSKLVELNYRYKIRWWWWW
jgi:hypothetical protein